MISSLRIETDEKIKQFINKKKETLLNVTINQLQQKGIQDIPNTQQFFDCTKHEPLQWNVELKSVRGRQTEESIVEQESIITCIDKKLDDYINLSPVTLNSIFIGGPGVGKTTVLQLAALCAFKKGLNTALYAVMAERATQLGGVHLKQIIFNSC